MDRETIELLKTRVFSFDTFFVTSVENYEADGVVFKGNVRGKDPATSYAKINERLRAQLGDKYELFLLYDREDKPTVVLLPFNALGGTQRISPFTERWVAATFAVASLLATIQANNAPILQFLLFPGEASMSVDDLREALPGTLAFTAALVAHEVGHWREAKRYGVDSYLPFLIPAGLGFLGSFGGITRLKGFLPDRDALLNFASKGPLLGAGVSVGLLFTGLVLSSLGIVDVGVDSPSFSDSLFVALAVQAFLGDQLGEPVVQVNSLFVAGWAGLVVNALACIPAGESDGGRIATAIWGRRGGTALGIWSAGVLTIGSFSSALAFFYLLLLLVTQRGPVLPARQELTDCRDQAAVTRGYVLLALPLLVLFPFPVDLVLAVKAAGAQLMNPYGFPPL